MFRRSACIIGRSVGRPIRHFRTVIKHGDLDKTLTEIATDVKIQKKFTLCGLTIYPTLAALIHPTFIFSTPVCVGIHATTIKNLYEIARKYIRDNPHLLVEWKCDKLVDPRFFIDMNGDLCIGDDLQTHHHRLYQRGHVDDPYTARIRSFIGKFQLDGNRRISYAAVDQETRMIVNKIFGYRSMRFRTHMFSMILCIALITLGTTVANEALIIATLSIILPIQIFTDIRIRRPNVAAYRQMCELLARSVDSAGYRYIHTNSLRQIVLSNRPYNLMYRKDKLTVDSRGDVHKA